jgi:hypothetical protein
MSNNHLVFLTGDDAVGIFLSSIERPQRPLVSDQLPDLPDARACEKAQLSSWRGWRQARKHRVEPRRRQPFCFAQLPLLELRAE